MIVAQVVQLTSYKISSKETTFRYTILKLTREMNCITKNFGKKRVWFTSVSQHDEVIFILRSFSVERSPRFKKKILPNGN